MPQASSPNRTGSHRLLLWALGLFVLPLALFVAVALLLPSRGADVIRISSAQLWLEPLGNPVFDDAYFQNMVRDIPDFSKANWHTVSIPNSIKLGESIDLPDDAPKTRAWFKVQVPDELLKNSANHGRLGFMGNRVMGGPWAVYANGHLLQANLEDWRIQWNTPMRVMLPAPADEGRSAVTEFLIAVPFPQVKGYAMGSLYVGSADAVDAAWQTRNFWHADAPRAASIVAFLLMLLSLQLALGRRKELVFILLAANTLLMSIGNLQYFYDFTGQDRLSLWFGFAMDAAITWSVTLNLLFAYEFEKIRVPRINAALIVYTCLSTLVTLPLWDWKKNALMLQHDVSALVFVLGLCVFARHVFRNPKREGVVMLAAMLAQLLLGVHDLYAVTNQAHPDQFHIFPLGAVAIFLAFMYSLSRRTVLTMNAVETHQAELEAKLADQQIRLTQQHAVLQRMEIENRLTTQREALMQDLHDGLGSNLTTALLQARSGAMTPQDTVLLLQDLADELRNLNRASDAHRNVNDILANLRQRIQRRLQVGGIALIWNVDHSLPPLLNNAVGTSQHLNAMLSEAIANIIKHAHATEIGLNTTIEDHVLVIEIVDNGCGFDVTCVNTGRGLPGMQRRALLVDGQLQVTSQPGGPTRWRLGLPVVL